MNSDQWIQVAKSAGQVARNTVRRAWGFEAIRFPRALEVVLGRRMDGTLTAARRAFWVSVHG